MDHPILNHIGTVFIPVKNIVHGRDWYCDLLGISPDGEILFGHIYVIPMKGTGIVLDSKIYSEENLIKTPLFHLDTEDIEAAYRYIKGKGIQLVTEIQHEHYFNFQDPFGNQLMICKC
ncbi:VOC family protein [Halobacillus sp. BBL2006]|uniref:VOC family protein n=1 Tax=Halobacillus sp. BBL2006 TaxID=1543706 RepID=UPI000543C7F7|nr:VOC family protein [Halobacillus sp. BBL2006]KHE71990.1 glyoxalase [Halobacillus sp. BBL2006]